MRQNQNPTTSFSLKEVKYILLMGNNSFVKKGLDLTTCHDSRNKSEQSVRH